MTTEQSAPISNEPVSSDSNKTKKHFIIGFAGFLGFALIASMGVGVYRTYAKASTDGFTVAVSSVLRLPALKVNGETIRYSDYADDLKAITLMRDYDKAKGGPAGTLTEEQLSDQVLFRQVNNVLVNSLSNKYGVKVEASDVEAVKSDILTREFQSLENAEKAIMERYGWTLATFEKKVIRPFILQNKLNEKLKNDEVSKEQIKKKADDVLSQIKGGSKFEEMAKQYGEDGTASNGGDLGWFGKGEMVPAFETAAFGLKKGEMSPTVVESPFGYHIILVEDKKVEKVKNADGKTENKEMVKARHILFLFQTLDKQLNDEVKNAQIKIYPRIHNPFEVLNQES